MRRVMSAIVIFSLLLSPFALAATPDSGALVPAKDRAASHASLATLEVDGRFGNCESFARNNIELPSE